MAANFVTVDQIVINYSLGIDPDDYGSNVSDVMMLKLCNLQTPDAKRALRFC